MFPSVRVDDIQIHPRTSDLVIATHGRSIAILDDNHPRFREIHSGKLRPSRLNCLALRSVSRRLSSNQDLLIQMAKGFIAAKNPPEGALFTVWVREFYRRRNQNRRNKNQPGQPVCKSKKRRGTPGFYPFELGPAARPKT